MGLGYWYWLSYGLHGKKIVNITTNWLSYVVTEVHMYIISLQ